MEINNGFFIQLNNHSTGMLQFSASTCNLDKNDFKILWEMIGKKILDALEKDKNNSGMELHFEISASKL